MTCAGGGAGCGGSYALSLYSLTGSAAVNGTLPSTQANTTVPVTQANSTNATTSASASKLAVVPVGCFRDSETRLLSGDSVSAANMTAPTCQKFCFDGGYLYAGVEYGSQVSRGF